MVKKLQVHTEETKKGLDLALDQIGRLYKHTEVLELH